jgi:predicted methyltransferase
VDSLIPQIKSQNTDLKAAEIAGILYLILEVKDLTNSELIRLTGIPKETLRRFKSTISSMLEDSKEEGLSFKDNYRAEIQKLNLQPYAWNLFQATDTSLAQRIAQVRTEYSLQPKREFDQFFATPETTASKHEVLRLKDQIANKKIALIGDDDLLSIALGSSQPFYSKVDVFEIDVSLIDKLKKISNEKNLKEINFIQFDVRKEPLRQFEGRYDVVVIDPPYTVSGVTLFLNRALQLIGKKEDAYIFLFFGNSFKSPEKFIKVQELINRFGLVIEDKIDKFARYYGAESIGSASSLYVLKMTPFAKPLDPSVLPKVIYTFENEKEEKFPYVDHVVAKIQHLSNDIVKSKSKITSILGDLCKRHKFKVVDTKVTDFKGGGMTITYVLANSNLILHTWPEFGAVHLDLITCSPIYRKDLLVGNLSDLFKTNKIEYLEVQ